MKKQIFIIVLFVLAFVANVNNSYGQAVCTPSAMNPAPGVPYDYEVKISGTTGGTGGTYSWYVTQGLNLLTATQIAAGTDYIVNSGTGTNKINITWTSAALATAKPYYLVVDYTETSTAGCSVKNMKVYEIKPINTFLLAVVGSDATGDAAKATTCPPAIDGATVTVGTPSTVEYTYGQTLIYYKVTASGVIGNWTPSIKLPALGVDGQNYNNAEWSLDNTTWHSFGLSDGNTAGGNFTSTDPATASVAGTSIIVRIKIDNVNYESLVKQDIVMAVDGTLPGGTKDIKSASDCTDEVDFGKSGTHTIAPRPTVTDVTPSFLLKKP